MMMMHLISFSSLGEGPASCVKDIHRSATSLLEMVNTILSFSKTEAVGLPVKPSPFVLSALVDTVSKAMAPLAAAKSLHLSFRIDAGLQQVAYFLGDGGLIKHVLINFVGNAIKFTPEGGKITVEVSSVSLAVKVGDFLALRFAVSDTGIGIAPADIGYIFEPFRQVDLAVGARGTGLGLSICTSIAEATQVCTHKQYIHTYN